MLHRSPGIPRSQSLLPLSLLPRSQSLGRTRCSLRSLPRSTASPSRGTCVYRMAGTVHRWVECPRALWDSDRGRMPDEKRTLVERSEERDAASEEWSARGFRRKRRRSGRGRVFCRSRADARRCVARWGTDVCFASSLQIKLKVSKSIIKLIVNRKLSK